MKRYSEGENPGRPGWPRGTEAVCLSVNRGGTCRAKASCESAKVPQDRSVASGRASLRYHPPVNSCIKSSGQLLHQKLSVHVMLTFCV